MALTEIRNFGGYRHDTMGSFESISNKEFAVTLQAIKMFQRLDGISASRIDDRISPRAV
jgi:hypothetical protein